MNVNSENRVIQGLWVGNRLSVMEQLSIRSFLANGHDYHLYAYEQIDGLPVGTVIKDANEILPASAIFRYADHDSFAGFSNFFRFKLLLERGGWWSDSDVVCLKPYNFDEPYVFPSQHNQFMTGEEVWNGAIKVPPSSDFAAYAWNVCQSKDTRLIRWGETGPVLTRTAVEKFDLQRYVKNAAVFCPVPFKTWSDLLDGDRTWNFGDETFAVHLWNELWRRDARDKDATYPSTCLYERLKQLYPMPSVALAAGDTAQG
jgi:Glycosyltransferase sugar-binding region containing DXD motif